MVTLRWAIISTGQHANTKIAPAMALTPEAELVAVYSRDRARAETFAQQHDAQAAYDSVQDLLRDDRVDAVFVNSPNALHADVTLQAAKAGKHVLTEKPMATTLNDAVAMVRGCRDAGVKLGVGFHLRQHPVHREARRLLSQGVLGQIALAQAQWGFGVRGEVAPPPRQGLRQWWDEPEMIGWASTMMGTGVHVVDTLRFLLSQEVTEVAAITDGQRPQQPLEQLIAMSLRFEAGVIATVCCGRRLPDSHHDVVIYGSEGRISGLDTLREGRQGGLQVMSQTVNKTESVTADLLANYVDELSDFHQAIIEDREPAATGLDGLQVVQVTLAMIASARDKRTVTIEPIAV
ncbi:MAG: Gfo/Idh/MocA family oxidoreductase [bacterium]|nr:Gfo/Idh/MocA family oxidoreductase [bacterium]